MSETPSPDHPHTAADLLPRRLQRFATLFAAVAVGIARRSCGTRIVIVPECQCSSTRPVSSHSGYSLSGTSGGATHGRNQISALSSFVTEW